MIALLMRDVGRRLSVTEEATGLQSALAAIIEQTGKTSLRELVQGHCGPCGTALHRALRSNLPDGNRTAAAEILGMSRQGFYKKLAQYEIGWPFTAQDP